jgi:DNA polymerase-3 subunit alpha/error-prone DNA polymerase
MNILPAVSKSSVASVAPKGFVELLARSNFSFLQAASHPEEMVEQAIRLDYEGIGLCDLNGLYGVVRGYQTITSPSSFVASLQAKKNFSYLLGTEITLTDASSVVLMPMKKSGYSHLCQLLTYGKRAVAKGFSQIHPSDLQLFHQDLLAFLLPPLTEERFLQMSEIFGDRLYVPVWRDLTWESRELYKQALYLEDKYQAQLFVTNRPLMHVPERKPLLDVVTCILHHTTLEKAKQILAQNAERYLRPKEELFELWKDRLDLVEATLDIAARIEFNLQQIRYRYPESKLPTGKTAADWLRDLVERGLAKRYQGQGIPEEVKQVARHELKVIRELEYEDYFLTLWEICQFAQKEKILYQGRGSAANSVVCYALELTAVNPVQMGLLFERFISLERAEPPDIDIDFEHSRREEVIQHIYQKYDERHAAMVCTVIRYRSRMALRETAKVFGVPLDTVNRMIKFMGRDGMRRLAGMADDPQQRQQLSEEIRRQFGIEQDVWRLMLILTEELKGFPRHLGIHTGGFLITQDPITEMVPVEKATMQDRYVIQWNKDDINTLKLMKIDVLSLGMLTALRKCLELLNRHKNLSTTLAELPHDDPATYEMICQADTVGVFQIESRAQMNTLPRLRPRNFYDLVVQVAIVRPGPLQGGMVHPYLRRRQGLEKINYPHKDLEPILEKTMGVPIFQEQVMKMVVAVAGFTPGEADELRRIMSNSWRKKGTMEGVRERILRGMQAHGIENQYAEQIYQTIEGFANYGFPESHSASFALLTSASCYLKKHHPDVFVCALLNSQPMGFYPPRVLIADAQRHGVFFLPLDVQASDYDYTLEGVSATSAAFLPVREGLRTIYGVSEKWLRAIEVERKEHGIFSSLSDFVRRTRLPKNLLMKLAAAGAMKCFHENVRELLWKIEALSLDQESFLWGQSRYGDTPVQESEQDWIPAESVWDMTRREYDSKGFSLELHPLRVLRPFFQQHRRAYFNSQQVTKCRHRQRIVVAGLISITQRPPTAKGMCFITLEDEFGFMNIVIHPQVYEKDRMAIYSSALLEVQGVVERTGNLINIRATQVRPLFMQMPELEASHTSL